MTQLRLTRHTTNRFIAGVCGGLGDYLNLDATLVRAAFVVLSLASGIAIPLYVVLMLVLPNELDVDLPLGEIMRHNLDEFGQFLAQLGEDSSHRQTAALVLVVLGGYLFLQQIGLFGREAIGPFLLFLVGVLVYRRWRGDRDREGG